MLYRRLLSVACVIGALAGFGGAASAAPFTPAIDEFWVVKNASETFRDSFNDGVAAPSGPQDGVGGNPDTYTVFGAGGVTGEAGGRLTMTPLLGDTTLVTNEYADLGTVVTKLRSTGNGNANSLEQADSFEIHGLYDLTSLPEFSGQSFGIRASDRAPNLNNEGDDTISLLVGRSINTGVLGVALHEIDFAGNDIDRVDFIDVQALLTGGNATQIELVITKAGGTAEIGAYFNIWGLGGMQGGILLNSQAMDTFSTEKGENLAIYGGETYTRAQFAATDRVELPAPASLGLFVLGLGWLARQRRKG